MPQNQVDLASIFGTVTQALAENQPSLNQADASNQDHGNNMVQTFSTITQALQQKQGSSNSEALKYAAQQVANNSSSGSGQLYAQNLDQAANQLKGKEMDTRGAMELLQTLIGGGQGSQAPDPSAANNSLGTLLNNLNSGAAPNPQQTPQGGGDMLGSLLGGLAGEGTTGQPSSSEGGLTGGAGSSSTGQGGFGMQNLLNAGMAYFQATQQGGNPMQSLVQAFVTGSGMGNDPHRQQSTAVVVNSFLQALGSGGSH
jgi:hypothetical protein